MSTFKINRTDTFINTAKSKQNIKLLLKENVLYGNIIEEPIVLPPIGCELQLNFSCEDNSQYLPLI
jgi:hypothetical protein